LLFVFAFVRFFYWYFFIIFIENWASRLSLDPRFYMLWILDVRPGLENLPGCVGFFSSFFWGDVFFYLFFSGLPIIVFQFHPVSFFNPSIIHEIIFFLISPLNIFLSFKFDSHSFNWYLFCLSSFFKLFFFQISLSLNFFFYQILS
jgi:hypothetical protein